MAHPNQQRASPAKSVHAGFSEREKSSNSSSLIASAITSASPSNLARLERFSHWIQPVMSNEVGPIRDDDRTSLLSVASRDVPHMAYIKYTDMPISMQHDAVYLTNLAFSVWHGIEAEIAGFIKTKFEEKYGIPGTRSWHVVVGRNYGCFVTHRTGYLLYFYFRELAILVFRTDA